VDKRKLKALVEDLTTRMPIEDVAEGMAFDDVDALRMLLNDARAALPPELRKEFDKAKDEIKTVDDLTRVLNRLFTKYGETLPYHYMIIDFGGKESIWVRMADKRQYVKFKEIADRCREHGKTFRSALLKALSFIDDAYFDNHADELEDAQDESAENAEDEAGVDQ
jgi:siroheme synthase (precorrin-2 oxidase/ferrochelatase)